MSMESPILTVACISLPPGPGARCTSVAPNAFVRKSMYLAAPLTDRCGVKVWKPGGIGVVAFAIMWSIIERLGSGGKSASGVQCILSSGSSDLGISCHESDDCRPALPDE